MNNEKYSYAIGESVTLGATALDDVDGSVDCTYSGTVNNQIPGEYTIIYSAVDAAGNTATLSVIYIIYEPTDYLSMDLMSYYDDAEGLEGDSLVSSLRNIVSNYTYQSYDQARYILDETDADPNNSNNVILVYSQDSVSGVWDQGATWNREHIWPQSYLPTSIMEADLHNLKPAYTSWNSSRGNKYYGNALTTSTYLPNNQVKGDIARILFYMVIRYEALELTDNGNLIVADSHYMGLLSVLLDWHYQDPVDDFERNRNEVIYTYQNNRNPFIDYEHFVEMIWKDHDYFLNA